MTNLLEYLLASEAISDRVYSHIKGEFTEDKDLIQFVISRNILSVENFVSICANALKDSRIFMPDIDMLPTAMQEKIAQELAQLLEIEYIDLEAVDINVSLASKVPLAQLQKAKAIPISTDDIRVLTVFADPLDLNAQDVIQRVYAKKLIRPAMSLPQHIDRYLNKLEVSESIKGLIDKIRNESRTADAGEGEESSAIMQLINIILKTSIVTRGSDIHIEPSENSCSVRTRIDGVLSETFIFDKDIYSPLSSRLKLLSSLDIAEKRKPQDGRFSAIINDREYDFRVSTLPIVGGESIVMRILDKSKAMIKLEDAGMHPKSFKVFTKGLKAPYGVILVTGPTGSGKSTTLYGALNMVKNVDTKVITVEDPVEYQMNLIQQVHVNPKAGLTFAGALRSILRQDPDIIMIGEIRDKETLEIAIQAALTGHLVLSTLHTNDAISAVTRIADMGVEPFMVSGALVAIEAQRLVRKICPFCREKTTPMPEMLTDVKHLLPKNYQFYKGRGCRHCNETGYLGREMVSEVLNVSETIATMIAKEESKDNLKKQALQEGFFSMLLDGISKAMQGKTTLDEVLRVAKVE